MYTRISFLIGLLLIAALPLSACQPAAATPTKIAPAKVETLEASSVKRVILTEQAAQRLGIQTAQVVEEPAERLREVGGQVVGSPGGILVRVSLSRGELAKIDRNRTAFVLPLDDDGEDNDEAEGEEAEFDDDNEEDGVTALYYSVADGGQANFTLGQPVRLKLALLNDGAMQKMVPYSAIIYDVNGGTWVYTKEPNALAYVRVSITIDYIDDDEVFLLDGPAAGTEIVTVGGALLYGTETGVSK